MNYKGTKCKCELSDIWISKKQHYSGTLPTNMSNPLYLFITCSYYTINLKNQKSAVSFKKKTKQRYSFN